MMLARIRQALTELEGRDYWQAMQAETGLAEIIRVAIEEEVKNHQISFRIRQHLGGMAAHRRAQKIARTEVTGALNAGHEVAREELVAEGLVTGKRWLTIGNEDVRTDHAIHHNQAAAPKEKTSTSEDLTPPIRAGGGCLGSNASAAVARHLAFWPMSDQPHVMGGLSLSHFP